MDDTLRDRVEAELDRREAEARLELDPADALRRYAAARRVLARHRPRTYAAGTALESVLCLGCRFGTSWPCPELRDLADSLGLSTTSEEQHHG